MNEAASSVEPEVKTRFATVDAFHKVDTVIYQPRGSDDTCSAEANG
jgi:hypothetical protein